MTADVSGEYVQALDQTCDHEFLSRPQYAGTTAQHRCGFCGNDRAEHGEPSPQVRAGAEALVAMWPGWLKDGGGIWAKQDAQVATTRVLHAVQAAEFASPERVGDDGA